MWTMLFQNGIAGLICILMYIILKLTWPLSDAILSFFYHWIMGPKKPLPPIKNNLLLFSATELAEKIRMRQVKCEDVMTAYIERSREVHPFINAVIDERYEDALNDARGVDQFLELNVKTVEEIARDTPLLGVPFTCKEEVGVKEMAQTCGLMQFKDHVAESDAEVTSRYRKAGAIPVTVTNVAEACLYWDTFNLIFGRTKNPYDHTRSVAGTTGGEAALIGSGGALIGLSDDLGGSIRLPASFCGIYGHKPTPGIVSNKGIFPDNPEEDAKIEPFMSTGCICRYAKDLPLLMQVLTCDGKIQINKKVDFSNVKIYFMEEFPGFFYSAIPEIKQKIRMAAKHFEVEFGAKAIPLKMDELKYAFRMSECKMIEINIPPTTALLCDKNGDASVWWELLKTLFGKPSFTLHVIFYALHNCRSRDKFYYKDLELYQEVERKFQSIFYEDAILLVPTHPEPPAHFLMTIPKLRYISYTLIFSLLRFPCTQIPAGMYKNLPVGIQAVSGPFKDHLTLAAAQELGKVFGGWISPSDINVDAQTSYV